MHEKFTRKLKFHRDRLKSQIVERPIVIKQTKAESVAAASNPHSRELPPQFSTVEQQICIELDTGIITKVDKPIIKKTLGYSQTRLNSP